MRRMGFIATLGLPAVVFATALQAGSFEGYLVDVRGAVVRTPYGECIRTGYWDRSYAQPECDELLEARSIYRVEKKKAVEEGRPAPAKPAIMVEMERKMAPPPQPEPAVVEQPVVAAVEVGEVAVGETVTEIEESASTPPEPEIVLVDRTEVGNGESLWSIADRPEVYGNARMWPLLLCSNRDQIVDADLIYSGQLLRVDRTHAAAAVAAAISHADMRGEWELGEVEDVDLEYLAVHCSR